MDERLSYFNISWYSETDGPGKRLVLFLQGCPLNCVWCHSPHSQLEESPLLYFNTLCQKCRRCETACPNAVHEFREDQHFLNREKCTRCGACVEACPQSSTLNQRGALVLPTRHADVSSLFETLKPHLDLLKNVGGITFSGGEPLRQSAALSQLAKKCKEYGFHTALETSGIVPLSSISLLSPYIDTWLVGMRLVTSADDSNARYLENQTRRTLLFLKQVAGNNVIVRIPVIPGFTTTEAYLTTARQILKDYHITNVEILPFNPETSHYYQAMGLPAQVNYDLSQTGQLFKYVSDFLIIN
jgi:glycyl-radical enzyme activating protein